VSHPLEDPENPYYLLTASERAYREGDRDELRIVDLSEGPDPYARDEELIAEARRRFEVGQVIEQFGAWAVTDYGIECLTQHYPIEKRRFRTVADADRLTLHLSSKRRIHMTDFLRCLAAARRRYWPDQVTKRRIPHGLKAGGVLRQPIPPRMRFRVLRRDGYRCRLCGRAAEDGVILHVDHIIPLAKGGKTEEANLWSLCLPCNLGKGAQDLGLGDECPSCIHPRSDHDPLTGRCLRVNPTFGPCPCSVGRG
jgi:5-methylcytosine-specific restriction endonuclease McrA